jgi:hypothetical protein
VRYSANKKCTPTTYSVTGKKVALITTVLRQQLSSYKSRLAPLRRLRQTTIDSLRQLADQRNQTKLTKSLYRSVLIQLADFDIEIDKLEEKCKVLESHLEGRGQPWSLCSIA